jgi:hypothetical protein
MHVTAAGIDIMTVGLLLMSIGVIAAALSTLSSGAWSPATTARHRRLLEALGRAASRPPASGAARASTAQRT